MAWMGLKAEGYPEVAMNYFEAASSTEELIVLAWLLEEATQKFYRELVGTLRNEDTIRLFDDLAKGEEKHKSMLEDLYGEFAGRSSAAGIQEHTLLAREKADLMEGGVKLGEASDWVRGREEKDILEFTVTLEANAYDRYLTMTRVIESEMSKRVFDSLSKAEKQHLERLTEAFEQTL